MKERRSAPTSRSTGADLSSGCYTSARYEAGVVWHVHRHAGRLRRDAVALGFEPPGAQALATTLVALGREAFGAGAGVVRLALRHDPKGGPRAIEAGSTRELGAEPPLWRALVWPELHPGAGPAPGVKHEGVTLYERARAGALRAGADEALLMSGDGCLVEGARTNVIVVRGDGALLTPPLSRGAVAGVAREIVLERVPEIREDEVPLATLAGAREVVLMNAVRGAVRLAALDGRRLGDGAASPWTQRLHALLRSDPAPR